MPNKVVDIDLQTSTSATPRDTYSDLVLLGTEPDVADPTYNRPIPYNDADDVAAAYGADSDVAIASKSVDAKGTEAWWVVMADYDEHTNELLDGSDSSSVSSGTVDNTPIRGGVENITITLDGTDQTIVPTTETPPQAPAAGEAAVNFDTGEITTGESTSGSGSGIEVTYDSLHWQELSEQMEAYSLDLLTLADVRADKSYIGDLDEAVSFSEANGMSVIIAYDDAGNYADQTSAMEAYHAIGAYLPSKAVLPIGHFSSGQVAAEQAGRIATKPPWRDPYWDAGANYSFNTEYFRESMIGEPGEPNTLEGGNASEEGPVNVIKPEGGTKILSNSLTTAGAGSNYQWFDVYRTETFIADEVENALTQMRLANEQIPFAPNGRTIIMDALRSRLGQYVASGRIQTVRDTTTNNDEEIETRSQTAVNRTGAPLSDLSIRVPRHSELSSTDKKNRVWSGIQISGVLASNAHTFSVTLDVEM
jgi:hypothetical protein